MVNKGTVVISGFGPFGQHTVNASWASIKEIDAKKLENKNDIKLEQIEVPVIYEAVDNIIPSIWNNNPILVIHVGVSHMATSLVLESVACGGNYTRLDCDGVCPSNKQSEENIDKIHCGMNVEKLCAMYNKQEPVIKASVSTDAGRYLCEYIYYSSLKIDPLRTLFIHVPVINETFSASDIAKGLETIISLCLDQLKLCECSM